MALIDVTVCVGCLDGPIPVGKYCRACRRSNPREPGHYCHARGCNTKVKPELLMCLKHWRMVPRAVQNAVWANYRPGQCDDKDPSATWHSAADAAIGYVARKEGQPVMHTEATALARFRLA